MRNSLFVLLMLASAWSDAKENLDGAIGVCRDVLAGSVVNPDSAFYSIAPASFAADLQGYKKFNKDLYQHLDSAKVSILKMPSHGMLVGTGNEMDYHPNADYEGEDTATILVEIGGYTIKVVYYIHVGGGGTDEQLQNDTCPDPYGEWKISSTEIGVNNENT